MNKTILMGRLTRDPEIRTAAGGSGTTIARFTLAVNRRFRRDSEESADFINCVGGTYYLHYRGRCRRSRFC